MSLETNVIVLAVLILLSAFFSSAELAIFSINKAKLRKLVNQKKRNAQLLVGLKSNPQSLLNTILIGNNLVNVGAASLATAVALEIFPAGYGIAIATGVITLAILVFGEITPKSIALKHNERLALSFAPVLKGLAFVFSPVLFVLNNVTSVFVRVLGGDTGSESLTEDEVKTVVSLGAEEGAIQKEEKEMIHRIFKLNDITVEDVMTARSEVAGVESGTKVKDVDKALMQEHSRIPVYKDDLDEVIGIFHIRDYLGSNNKSKEDVVVDKFMRPAVFVYGAKKIDRLLKEFQGKKTHMAVVVDEYGGTIGVVTIEDILEEIVGEIMDETDVEPKIKKVNSREFVVEGSVSLEVFCKTLRVSLKQDDYDTVAGLVISALDHVPREKEEVVVANLKFVVEKMDGPRIVLVRVFK